jgi:hypothetical protein
MPSTEVAMLRTLALALILAAPAIAAAKPARASIAFANKDGILDWKAADDQTIYLKSIMGKWYRADLFSPCRNLPYGNGIGFRTNPDGSFDRFSAVIVDGANCPLKELTALDGPPPKSVK